VWSWAYRITTTVDEYTSEYTLFFCYKVCGCHIRVGENAQSHSNGFLFSLCFELLPPFSLLRNFSFQNTSEHFTIRFRQSYLIWEVSDITIYFFLKHFSGPESGILEFDWLLTRVPPVQFFPIRTGFVLVTARINRAKTIEWKLKNNIPRLNSRIFLFTTQWCDFFGKSQFLCVL